MSTPLDRELAAALVRGGQLDGRCACGVPAATQPAFHKRAAYHDCPHHPRRACGWCRSVERLVTGVEARLYVEATSGPFIVTRWEA